MSGWILLLLCGLCCNPIPAATATRQLLGGPCSSSTSPVQSVSGSSFSAQLSGNNNAKGSIDLTVDQGGQRASWNLNFCDVAGYISSHLHTGSPVLVPLEPYTKPFGSSDSGDAVPQLCPAQDISGCSYSRQGSFNAGDLVSGSWDDFMQAIQSGSIYIVISTSDAPSGFMGANLAAFYPGPSGPAPEPVAAAPAPAPEPASNFVPQSVPEPMPTEPVAHEAPRHRPAPAAPPAAPRGGAIFNMPRLPGIGSGRGSTGGATSGNDQQPTRDDSQPPPDSNSGGSGGFPRIHLPGLHHTPAPSSASGP